MWLIRIMNVRLGDNLIGCVPNTWFLLVFNFLWKHFQWPYKIKKQNIKSNVMNRSKLVQLFFFLSFYLSFPPQQHQILQYSSTLQIWKRSVIGRQRWVEVGLAFRRCVIKWNLDVSINLSWSTHLPKNWGRYWLQTYLHLGVNNQNLYGIELRSCARDLTLHFTLIAIKYYTCLTY